MSARPSLKASPCQTRMELVFAGETMILDASGALFFPEHTLLAVSDLHLEKGSFFAARGNPMPCLDTRDTLERLSAAIECYRPKSVVSLGDSFHDRHAADRIAPRDAALLHRLVSGVEAWIWVTGNHDPHIAPRFEGFSASVYQVGLIHLSHRPEDAKPPLIAGHYHPKHRLRATHRTVSGPCFVLGPDMMLMPAFGAYTGGLDVLSEPIASLFSRTPNTRWHILLYGKKLWLLP